MLQLYPTKLQLMQRWPVYLTFLGLGTACFIAGQSLSKPQVVEVITTRTINVIQEKEIIKYVEVEKERTQHTEITKPDGTRIVTTIQSKEETKESSKETEDTKVAVEEKTHTKEEKKDKYYLGLSLDLQRTYSVIGGVRLGDLPLYLTGQVSVYPFDKLGVGLGLSYHF